MQQNDIDIHTSIDTHTIDERVEQSLARFFRRYFWRIINVILSAVGILGFIFFNVARDEHRVLTERLDKLEKVVEEKTGETESIQTYLQTIENNLVKKLAEAKAAKDVEEMGELKKLIELLQEARRKKEK